MAKIERLWIVKRWNCSTFKGLINSPWLKQKYETSFFYRSFINLVIAILIIVVVMVVVDNAYLCRRSSKIYIHCNKKKKKWADKKNITPYSRTSFPSFARSFFFFGQFFFWLVCCAKQVVWKKSFVVLVGPGEYVPCNDHRDHTDALHTTEVTKSKTKHRH